MWKRGGMAKFKLRDWVLKIGQQEVRSVQEIREKRALAGYDIRADAPTIQHQIVASHAETLYSIQLGRDFATRVWAKESELENSNPSAGHTLIMVDGSRIRIENVSEAMVDISPNRMVAPIPIQHLEPVPGEKDVWKLVGLSSTEYL
jgi:hypothetical protein